jgi:hypothetical protein
MSSNFLYLSVLLITRYWDFDYENIDSIAILFFTLLLVVTSNLFFYFSFKGTRISKNSNFENPLFDYLFHASHSPW